LKKLQLINASTVFIATLAVVSSIFLLVYLTGLENHRSLYKNALISTTILALALFFFISIGLYKGWKLKNTLGNFSHYFSKLKKPGEKEFDGAGLDSLEVLEAAEGIEGCLVSIAMWLVVGVFGSIILWAIGAFFWGIILVVAGILYWIIFRALRLIFRHSPSCKHNLFQSVKISFLYSILYVSWVYAVLYVGHNFI